MLVCFNNNSKADETEPQLVHYVVNGSEVSNNEWTGVFALYMSQGAICTASLIDPEVILTAGHCVYDGQYFSVQVLSGLNINYGGNEIANVEEVVKHPNWNGDIDYNSVDLALIHLSNPLNQYEVYGIRQNPGVERGESGTVVGYGLTSAYGNDSGIKRKGETTILQKSSDYGSPVLEVGNPAGLCMGDSGGPLFTYQNGKPVVTGVASYITNQNCSANSGSFEVDVLAHREWINSKVREWTGHDLMDIEPETCADNNDCEESYECIDGFCIFVPIEYSCLELYSCDEECINDYSTCTSEVSDQGFNTFNTLLQCVRDNCSNTSDMSSCIQNNCMSEYQNCYYDQGCNSILQCQQSYGTCSESCQSQGSIDGKIEYESMQNCFSSTCENRLPDNLQFKECIYTYCVTEINTCFEYPAPGNDSCDDLINCTKNCSVEDEECNRNCYSNGTQQARLNSELLIECSVQNCNGLSDVNCLDQNCGTFVERCFGSNSNNNNLNNNITNNGSNNNIIENSNTNNSNTVNNSNNNTDNTTTNSSNNNNNNSENSNLENENSNENSNTNNNNTENLNQNNDSIIPVSSESNGGCQCNSIGDLRTDSPLSMLLLCLMLSCIMFLYTRKKS